MPDAPRVNLPTADDLRQWRKERTRLLSEERAIKRRRVKLEKLIEATSAFLGPVDDVRTPLLTEPASYTQKAPTPESGKKSPRRPRGQSWTATIHKIVRQENRGMTYPELKAAVAQTHLGETLARTDKAFYGGIGKLAEKGDIIKHKGRVFSPLAYKKFTRDVEAGLVEDIAPKAHSGQHSPNKVVILETLSNRGDGVSTPEIIASLSKHPDTQQAVRHNRTPVYNLLARMVRRGELVKRGGKYFLPTQRGEAPGSTSEPSASHHDGGGNGNPSSTGGRGLATSNASPGAIPAHPGVLSPGDWRPH